MENIFIKWIYDSTRTSGLARIIYKIKFTWFMYKLDKLALNFDMLQQVADLIKALDVVFLYNNSKQSDLYSIVKPKGKFKEDINGFILNVKGHEIIFTLIEVDKYIHIEILNLNGTSRSRISFKDGDTDIIETVHDEQLFININDWLMDALIRLLNQHYKG